MTSYNSATNQWACCICNCILTDEEYAARNTYGFVCTEDRHKCMICYKKLDDEEIQVCSKTDFIFVCRQHWCSCMPDRIPWSYVVRCSECCEKTFCKTCKEYDDNGDTICFSCKLMEEKIIAKYRLK